MKAFIKVILLSAVLVVCLNSVCPKYDEEEDCYHAPLGCKTYAPTVGTMTIKVSKTLDDSPVRVWLYAGYIEDSTLVDTFLISGTDYTIPRSNGVYSARARYLTKIGGENKFFNAVDGGSLQEESEEYCEGTCYESGSITLDLKLARELEPISGG